MKQAIAKTDQKYKAEELNIEWKKTRTSKKKRALALNLQTSALNVMTWEECRLGVLFFLNTRIFSFIYFHSILYFSLTCISKVRERSRQLSKTGNLFSIFVTYHLHPSFHTSYHAREGDETQT